MSSQVPLIAEPGFSGATREEIRKDLDQLNKMTDKTGQIFTVMKRIQEEYVINFQQFTQIIGSLNDLASDQLPAAKRYELQTKLALRQKLEISSSQLMRLRLESAKKHTRTLSELEWIQRKVVIDARKIFQRKQQLAGNGASFDPEMTNELQEWCEGLADVILKNRLQIMNESELREKLPIDIPEGNSDDFPTLLATVNGLLAVLIKSSLIIEKQPPQVMKKDCKFSSTVRLLVGGKLNLQFDPPKVKAVIISEKQAGDVVNRKDVHAECGDILNGEGPMEYQLGRLNLTFRSMSLRGFQRPTVHRKTAEPVTEEKFCLLFTSEVTLSGQAQRFKIWTMSLPVVVTVHGNQECNAAATALWDNHFAEPERVPFSVREFVPWSDVAGMLSLRFYGWTGQGLDDRNLAYLANRLFGNDQNKPEVSWSKFNKDTMSGTNFTFWEWFWSVGRLVKESLKGIWQRGLIIGFVDRNESSSQLMPMPNGTFMLRFSDRMLGGVTVAWVKDNPDAPGGREVEHLRPFTIKDFGIRKLADRIHDLENLKFLYPDHCKNEVFGDFYTSAEEGLVDGYTAVTLINVIASEPSESVMDITNAGSSMGNLDALSPVASNSYSQPSPVAQNISQPSISPECYPTSFAQGFGCPPTPQDFSHAFGQESYSLPPLPQGDSMSTFMELDDIDIDSTILALFSQDITLNSQKDSTSTSRTNAL